MSIGNIHLYYREHLILIYERFGTGEFTCEEIRKLKGLKKFDCRKLRSWHNSKIVEYTTKKLRKSGKHMRVWRLTSPALHFLSGLP